jgi:hypothetical protein
LFAKRLLITLILLIPISIYGWWRFTNKKKEKMHTQEVEQLQALPYIQWSERKEDSSRLGVVRFDGTYAYKGYNLYTNDVRLAYLMDMAGKKLHTWDLGKKKKCEYVLPLQMGELLGVCMGQGLWKVDWDSNVIWKNRMFVHHDVEPLPDGTFWTIRREFNRPYKSRKIIFDSLQRVSADGELMENWSTFEHLTELQRWHEPSPLEKPPEEASSKKYDYYHLNTVKVLPENPYGRTDKRFQKGNILICLRNVNCIAILDRDSKKVVWGFGTDVLDWPHMPVMLSSGNILIFDNGLHRKYSRVVEINPVSKEIVWSYEAKPKTGFFSALQGSAQRLPNGNTLICESARGHVFEVNSKGEIVWDFWNPEMKDGKRKTIYRFLRIPFDVIPDKKIKYTVTGE